MFLSFEVSRNCQLSSTAAVPAPQLCRSEGFCALPKLNVGAQHLS